MADEKTMEIVERLVRIETMLATNMDLLNNKASLSEHRALESRVDKLESTNVWFGRTVGGLVIGAIMGLIFVVSKI